MPDSRSRHVNIDLFGEEFVFFLRFSVLDQPIFSFISMKYFYLLGVAFLFFLNSCGIQEQGKTDDSFLTFEAKNGFEILFDSWASKELKEYYQTGTIVINGSYFGQTGSSYYPAGIWNIQWQKYHQDTLEVTDPNLSHIILYDHEWWWIIFLRRDESLPDCAKRGTWEILCSVFQSWPWVLSWGTLEDFGNSWHANEPHERTLIGTTDEWKIYFFLFTKKVTLREAWESVMRKFQNTPITLINLDGGPSTAYFDGTTGFWEKKKLPILFRIKL